MKIKISPLPWWVEIGLQIGVIATVVVIQALNERKFDASRYQNEEE